MYVLCCWSYLEEQPLHIYSEQKRHQLSDGNEQKVLLFHRGCYGAPSIIFILFLRDVISQRRRSLNPTLKHEAVKDLVTKNCPQAELVRRHANCSSDPCQRTICSGSSQLSVSPDYNYEGKGHFSCSERHPNELVATYLTLLSIPLPQTVRTRWRRDETFLSCHLYRAR